MNHFRHQKLLQAARLSTITTTTTTTTCFTSKLRATPAPPFPTVETCPSPTCACAPMPENLDIDKKSVLNGVMSTYSEQVLVCTGRDDWASRIEDEKFEEGRDNVAAGLKGLFGRGGKFSDPFHNISVLNSSFTSDRATTSSTAGSSTEKASTTSAYLLPSFKFIPDIQQSSSSLEALAKGYLLPTKLHPMNDALSPEVRGNLTRDEAFQKDLKGVRDVDEILILVCGHGGRDVRCGVMGPLLRGEFESKLSSRPGFEVRRDKSDDDGAILSSDIKVRVGLVSHIGGHKFAGNVIIYIPPTLKIDGDGGKLHALAGNGIWYGRVEPRHVEGIIEETVVKGNVIRDMFRGGIDSQRKILRI